MPLLLAEEGTGTTGWNPDAPPDPEPLARLAAHIASQVSTLVNNVRNRPELLSRPGRSPERIQLL